MNAVPEQLPFRIELLNKGHNLQNFDCGSPPLNDFLQKFALNNQKADSSRTYLAMRAQEVVGFYSLVVGSMEYAPSAGRIAVGMPSHPIPTVVIARLGILASLQRTGIGTCLLKDALSKALGVSETIGVKAVIVDAKDENAKEWYKQFGFEPIPGRPETLFLLMKDIRSSAAKSADIVPFRLPSMAGA